MEIHYQTFIKIPVKKMSYLTDDLLQDFICDVFKLYIFN